jgi:hypothetical protein
MEVTRLLLIWFIPDLVVMEMGRHGRRSREALIMKEFFPIINIQPAGGKLLGLLSSPAHSRIELSSPPSPHPRQFP